MSVDCLYLHGKSRADAEKLLLSVGRDGCFLIRPSESSEGVFILCLLCDRKVYSYRILKDHSGYFYVEAIEGFLVKHRGGLTDLVEFYISQGSHNGLKTALIYGVKYDGNVSSDDSDDEPDFKDVAYETVTFDKTDKTSKAAVNACKPVSQRISPVQPDRTREQSNPKFEECLKTDILQQPQSNYGHNFPEKEALNLFITKDMEKLKVFLKSFILKAQSIRQEFFGSKESAKEIPSDDICTLLEQAKSTVYYVEALAKSVNEIKKSSSTKPEKFEVTSLSSQNHSLELHVDTSENRILALDGSSDKNLVWSCPIDKIQCLTKSSSHRNKLEIAIPAHEKMTLNFENSVKREHFCQFMHCMNSEKGVKSNDLGNSLSIFCGTWNMGNVNPPQLQLKSWLTSQGRGKTMHQNLSHIPHDIYAIGIQESKISEKDWVGQLVKYFSTEFNPGHELVEVCTMWQIRIAIFAKPEFVSRIKNTQKGVVKTGLANRFGNKGAAAVSFQIDDMKLCFVCTHLAANTERLARRNQNSRDIMKALSNSMGSLADADFTSQFHHIFWMGDLNYRVEGDIHEVLKLADNGKHNDMLEQDQLLKQINQRGAFFGFNEETVLFPPTYRYHKGSDTSFDWRKVKTTKEKMNTPSWCDRILWSSLPGCMITNTAYGIVQDMKTSDHKPVFASFLVGMEMEVKNKDVNSDVSFVIIISNLECLAFSGLMDKQKPDYSLAMVSPLWHGSQQFPTSNPSFDSSSEAIKWSNTITINFQATYIPKMNQHIIMMIKNMTSNVSLGDCVLPITQFLSSPNEEGTFKCELTYLGEATGYLSGSICCAVKAGTPSDVYFKQTDVKYLISEDEWAFKNDEESIPADDSSPMVRAKPIIRISKSKSSPYYVNSETVTEKQMSQRPVVPARNIYRPYSSDLVKSGPTDVTTFLSSLRLLQYLDTFLKMKWFTLDSIAKLAKDDLSAAGVRANHISLMMDAIKKLNLAQSRTST